MSHDILLAGKNHKHGLRDDIESLYYVVLYSGIRWLPHNNFPDLGKKMNEYFNGYQWEPDSDTKIKGGDEKFLNIDRGSFTKLFEWEDIATQIWMEYAWKIQKRRSWTPERFMLVWMATLGRDPPKQNRYEHKILIEGRNISIPTSVTNSVSCSAFHVSHVVSGPGPLMLSRSKNMPISCGLKRPLQKSLTGIEESNEKVESSLIVLDGDADSARYSCKKCRPDAC